MQPRRLHIADERLEVVVRTAAVGQPLARPQLPLPERLLPVGPVRSVRMGTRPLESGRARSDSSLERALVCSSTGSLSGSLCLVGRCLCGRIGKPLAKLYLVFHALAVVLQMGSSLLGGIFLDEELGNEQRRQCGDTQLPHRHTAVVTHLNRLLNIR